MVCTYCIGLMQILSSFFSFFVDFANHCILSWGELFGAYAVKTLRTRSNTPKRTRLWSICVLCTQHSSQHDQNLLSKDHRDNGRPAGGTPTHRQNSHTLSRFIGKHFLSVQELLLSGQLLLLLSLLLRPLFSFLLRLLLLPLLLQLLRPLGLKGESLPGH